MIKKLTKEQEARFPEFVKKWTDIGLCTEPANRPEAEEGIKQAYAIAGLAAPRIVWCGSPLSQGLTRAVIVASTVASTVASAGASVKAGVEESARDIAWHRVWDSVRENVWASVWASVRESVWASVWASVGGSVGASVRESVKASVLSRVMSSAWGSVGASVRENVWERVGDSVGNSVGERVGDSVGNSVRASVRDSVRASVGDSVAASVGASVRESVGDSVGVSVGDSVRDSVRASVRDSVWESVGASVGGSVWVNVGASVMASVWDSVRDSVWDSVYGQHEASWLGFYDYFCKVCGLVEQTKQLSGLWRIVKNAGWFLPHKNICWISERHNFLSRNEQGRLHCESGPAIAYPDGWSIYALNGILMKPEHVMTPASKLLPSEILKEENAEVRRELIRKAGIERMLSVLKPKLINKHGNYELLSVKLSDEVTDARYLKMVNPSIGTFHMEGVAPECDTVEHALNWRNNQWFTHAEILT